MQDFDHSTRILTENLARAIDRRTFLKRASQTLFGGLLAVAVGQVPARAAGSRESPAPARPLAPVCAPVGPYCNIGSGDLSGCHGAHCFQHLYSGQVLQCRVFYQYFQTGCWTNPGTGGYWTCCDCECRNSSGQRLGVCGWAQVSGNPLPQPMPPGNPQNS